MVPSLSDFFKQCFIILSLRSFYYIFIRVVWDVVSIYASIKKVGGKGVKLSTMSFYRINIEIPTELMIKQENLWT